MSIYVCHPCCNPLLFLCVSLALSFPCYVFLPEGSPTLFLVCTHVEFVSLGYLSSSCASIPFVAFSPKVIPTPLCVSLHAPLTHLTLWYVLSLGVSIPLSVSPSAFSPVRYLNSFACLTWQAPLTHLTPRHFLSPGVSSRPVVPTGPHPVVDQSRPCHRSAVRHL